MSCSLFNVLRLRGVRCKLAGETAEPGHGPYFEDADWRTEEQVRASATLAAASGRYKVIEIITHTRRNGRWQHRSRETVFRSQP